MDWFSFLIGIAVGIAATLLTLLFIVSIDDRPKTVIAEEPAVSAPSVTSAARDTYHAEAAAAAIRRLGASGAISREDAERIAKGHIERTS